MGDMMGDPIVLAFDCAGSACGVAITRGASVLAASRRPTERGHAALLAPAIAAALAEARLTPAALDLIAVTTGPGSFTGIRIGLATARGLALALARPLAGIDCFAALLASLDVQEIAARRIVVAIDSRRDELFFADGAGLDRRFARPADFIAGLPGGRYLAVGDAAQLLTVHARARGDLDMIAAASGRFVDAAALARHAAARGLDHWIADNAANGLPRPVYLRAPDVTLAKVASP